MTAADCAPIVAGVKLTLTVHELCPFRLAPQVVADCANSAALIPDMAILEIVMGVLSLFVSVTVFAALVFVRPWLPKANVLGETVAG